MQIWLNLHETSVSHLYTMIADLFSRANFFAPPKECINLELQCYKQYTLFIIDK
jgi:hypothetical protein